MERRQGGLVGRLEHHGAPDGERGGVRAAVDELLATDPDLRDRDEIVMPYRTDVFWTQRRTEGPDQAPATSV